MNSSIKNLYLLLWLALTSFGSLCHGLDYDGGVYILQGHTVANGTEVALPEGQFELKVTPDTTGAVPGANVYEFMFKFGNLMSSYAVLLPTGLTFDGFASTRMMPPADVYQLELDLQGILDSATKLTISAAELVIYGTTGTMSFANAVPPPSVQETQAPTLRKTTQQNDNGRNRLLEFRREA